LGCVAAKQALDVSSAGVLFSSNECGLT